MCDTAAMQTLPDPSLDLLAAELRILISALMRRLREQADGAELSAQQQSVLLRLERDGPGTGSALARAEGMRPQSMGAIVAALEAAGHVSGAPDPADGRQTIISLTAHFRDWVAEVRATRQDWMLRSLQANLDDQEQRQLAAALPLLQRLLDTPST